MPLMWPDQTEPRGANFEGQKQEDRNRDWRRVPRPPHRRFMPQTPQIACPREERGNGEKILRECCGHVEGILRECWKNIEEILRFHEGLLKELGKLREL